MNSEADFDRGIVAQIPVLIKARPAEANGRRIIEVQCSSETVDLDGDLILQGALLKSATSFINTGHFDIDHLSEFAHRLKLPEPPSAYIIGRPLDVRAGPNNTTFVEGEISKSIDGRVDVVRNRYDDFWMSLQRDPPVTWFSSIYGWPTEMEDLTRLPVKHASGATRLLIKSMDWRSLAFTLSPKNLGLTSPARIVSAKSYFAELAKSMFDRGTPPSASSAIPDTMADVWKAAQCQDCGVHTQPSLLGMKQHFMACKGYPEGHADIHAHAMMHRIHMRRAFGV